MIRSFEDVSLPIGQHLVGNFAGQVEFEFSDGDAHVKSITVASEWPGKPDLVLQWATGKGVSEAWLYALLAPALIERFRDDLIKITQHIRRRDPMGISVHLQTVLP